MNEKGSLMNKQLTEKESTGCWIKRMWEKLFGRKEGVKRPLSPKEKDIHDVAMDQAFGTEGGEGESWEHKGLWRR